MTRAYLLALAAARVAAQGGGGGGGSGGSNQGLVWGTYGQWDLVLPMPDASGNTNLPQQAYQHAAFVPGSLLVMSNITSAGQPTLPGSLDLFKYNPVTQQWSNPFDFVPASPTPLQIPFLFTYGGLACVVDEAAPTVLYCIDTSINGIGTPWMSFTVTGAPLGRIACRFLVWGSTLYMFGGFNPLQTPVTQSNDLWALDITGAVKTGAATWAQASPQADATGNVVGYPMPRIGFSWTPYEIGAIMFGGLSRPNNATGNPFDCIFIPRGQQPRGDCAFFQHVWALLPGFASASGVIPPTAWVMLNPGGDGRAPAGRVLHTAGQMGNQLYVFGGLTQMGPVQDLWAFDLTNSAWAQCTSIGPQPPFNAGWGVGVVMGYHFFNYIQQYDRNGIVANSGQLWRWTPIVTAGGGGFPDRGGASGPSSIDPIVMGHTAGIVLGLLLGGANLFYLYRLAQNARVDVCGCGARGPKGPDGYYAASTNAGGVGAAYEAPAI